jgi:UDPglucose--hexose-1-phosphate uridylyltransferase
VTELRQDHLTGRSVLVAEHRADRPNEFAALPAGAASPTADSAANCPFCPGHESVTPPSVYSANDPAGHWRVRVVPNKFPAVALDEPLAPGAHEVIIESARHVDRMGALSVDELADVLAAYRHRLNAWQSMGRFQYGLIFKNLGAPAGASLAHVHSQLIALPAPPAPVAAEFSRAHEHFAQHGRCAYCDLIAAERQNADRIVLDREGLVAFCPYASLQPGEVWIMPTTHEPRFERSATNAASPAKSSPSPTTHSALAPILHTLLVRIESVLPRVAYNLLVRTSPWQDDAAPCGHWRIEILPRVNALAGFELATHIHINPIAPHRAAQQLRSS